MEQSNEKQLICLGKVSYLQWIVVCVVLMFAIIGLFESYLPFLAERHYRDGFNLNAAGSNHLPAAIAEYEQAVRWAPWETQYALQLGKALEDYAGAIQNHPTEQLRFLRRAENVYNYIIELDPNNPWYVSRLISLYMYYGMLLPSENAKFTKMAEDAAKKAAELDNKNPLFKLSIAYFYHRANRLTDAEEYYKKSLDLDPDMVEALYNLADIYRRDGKTAQQYELYKRVYQVQPDFQNVRLLLAFDAYFRLKNDAQTQQYLEEQLNVDPYNLDAIKLLITIYHKANKSELAIPLYEKALLHYPNNLDLWRNYIKALVQVQNYSQAQEQSQQYLQVEPNNAEIRLLFTRLNLRGSAK